MIAPLVSSWPLLLGSLVFLPHFIDALAFLFSADLLPLPVFWCVLTGGHLLIFASRSDSKTKFSNILLASLRDCVHSLRRSAVHSLRRSAVHSRGFRSTFGNSHFSLDLGFGQVLLT